MDKNYHIIRDCNHYIFRRLIYPRFETIIDFKSLPVIKEIRYFEKCNASELEKVMGDIRDYLSQILLDTPYKNSLLS